LDPFGRKLLFILLVSVFILSTLEYKIKRVLVFGAFNNPTESVFLNIVLLTISSLVPLSASFKLCVVGFIVGCTMLANIYALAKLFTEAHSQAEKAEILDVAFYFLTISSSLLVDSPSFNLNLIEFSVLFHLMVLRLICCEIVKENCPTELFCFVLPVFLVSIFGVSNQSVHILFIILYALYCVWLWYSETGLICHALKMRNAFSKPPANNNPHQ